jgi:predicted PurR-regulated permease PerM
MDWNRQSFLGGLLALFIVLSFVTLFEILNVVVLAITVAYVLYPLRRRLANLGIPQRLASGGATLVAFLAVVALLVPPGFAIYDRRGQLLSLLDRIPGVVEGEVAGYGFALETAPLIDRATALVSESAVSLALAGPKLALELVVFTLLLYGLLYRPLAVREAMYGLVDPPYHDILDRLHQRTKVTLYSIYVVQAATAVGTSAVALVVFVLFDVPSPLWLSLFAGLLQFIPIVGPSIIIIALAANEILLGAPTRGVALLVVGLVVVGFMPDAVIRTLLADRTGELSASLYFIGFVGGILTVGPIGFIVGPLVVALLVEVVQLLSERTGEPSQSLGEPTLGDDHEQKSP